MQVSRFALKLSCAPGTPLSSALSPCALTVHGDLTANNAMLGPGPQPRLLFIDYEFAGLEGVARYPLDLNWSVYHNGAQAGELITHAHDVAMVSLWL